MIVIAKPRRILRLSQLTGPDSATARNNAIAIHVNGSRTR